MLTCNKKLKSIQFNQSYASHLKLFIWSTVLIITACTGPANQAKITLTHTSEFSSTDGNIISVPSGDYQLTTLTGDIISLAPESGGPSLLISAKQKKHKRKLMVAESLFIQSETGQRHLSLILPNGQLFEAIGLDALENSDLTERGFSLWKLRPTKKNKQKNQLFSIPKTMSQQPGQVITKGKFDPNAYYRLTTKWLGPNKSLSIINDGANDQPILTQSGSIPNQNWNIKPITGNSGYYRLTNQWQGSGKSLDIIKDSRDNKPILAKTGNYTGQNWKITPISNSGYYRLSTQWQGPNKSLDIINDNRDNRPTLANTGNYTGQYWKITKVKEITGSQVTDKVCTWKTSDIIDHRIDIGAQYSLMRKMSRGPSSSIDASAMIHAIKYRKLAGILLPPRTTVSDRGKRMRPPKSHWQLIPQGQNSICLKQPANEPPMIVYRQNLSKGQIDIALSHAWAQCELPPPLPPCNYLVDRYKPIVPPKPETECQNHNDCLDTGKGHYCENSICKKFDPQIMPTCNSKASCIPNTIDPLYRCPGTEMCVPTSDGCGFCSFSSPQAKCISKAYNEKIQKRRKCTEMEKKEIAECVDNGAECAKSELTDPVACTKSAWCTGTAAPKRKAEECRKKAHEEFKRDEKDIKNGRRPECK